jgi:D-alanyl-D-alanine carboxypeptidase (penicillin-binding protein 5/6)
MARRNGTTLIVTVLHCTSLQEVTSGEKLLNWGFAMDGKVRPVGELVSPLPAVTTSHVARHPSARRPSARHPSAQRTAARKTAAGAAVASSALPMAPLAAAGCLAFATGLGGALLVRRRRPARPERESRSGP